ncbi:hypothetical protein ALE3EI_1028 [Constantimarinum furrinae]|uniref:Uncharacterized protein n=2 Tax=Constantimarinum furrinae TaxID=2562285 RepID=A0A7G8PTD5_9FLAO|nr:hypothetical protein ALE3EI_1028 [Constantimarinum furrinae]
MLSPKVYPTKSGIFKIKLIIMKNVITLAVLALLFIGLNGFNKAEEKEGYDIPDLKIEVSDESIKTDGAILGSVIVPVNTEVCINVHNDKTSVRVYPNEQGEFFMNGFDQDVYDIEVIATQNNKTESYIIEDIEIRIGEVTAVGTIDF